MTKPERLAIWSTKESLLEKIEMLPAGYYIEWSISGHGLTIIDDNDEYVGYITIMDGVSTLYLKANDWEAVNTIEIWSKDNE